MIEQDRELLEAAARASGMKVFFMGDGSAWNLSTGGPDKPDIPWNPLQSDADAFRLMVDCAIDVRVRDNHVRGSNPFSDHFERFINPCADKHAATRRAIVRAAAAMSEGQEG